MTRKRKKDKLSVSPRLDQTPKRSKDQRKKTFYESPNSFELLDELESEIFAPSTPEITVRETRSQAARRRRQVSQSSSADSQEYFECEDEQSNFTPEDYKELDLEIFAGLADKTKMGDSKCVNRGGARGGSRGRNSKPDLFPHRQVLPNPPPNSEDTECRVDEYIDTAVNTITANIEELRQNLNTEVKCSIKYNKKFVFT